jgi:hypothetical protein
MERLWKQLMHLDARLLFFSSVALFLAVLILVVWIYVGRSGAPTAPPPPAPSSSNQATNSGLGVLRFVERQLEPSARIIPANPFRPGLEHLTFAATNEDASFSRATNATRSVTNSPPVRPKTNAPPGSAHRPLRPDGVYSYRGYLQRPDGTFAALFHNSADNSSRFVLPGDKLPQGEFISADERSARVRKPDGRILEVNLNETMEPVSAAK